MRRRDGGQDHARPQDHCLHRERGDGSGAAPHAGALGEHDESRHAPHLPGDVAAEVGQRPGARRVRIGQPLVPAVQHAAPRLDLDGVGEEDDAHRRGEPADLHVERHLY